MTPVEQMIREAGRPLTRLWLLSDQEPTLADEAEAETYAKLAFQSLGIPLETLAALRDGTWVAVPVNPTGAMLYEGYEGYEGYECTGADSAVTAVWDAMIAARPKEVKL